MGKEASRAAINRLIRSFLRKNRSAGMRKSDPVQEALKIIPQLSSVISVQIETNHSGPSSHPSIPALLDAAWTAVANKISSLTFETYSEDLAAFLPAIHFGCLEDLTVRVYQFFPATNTTAILQAHLPTLLQRHHQTLKRLALHIYEDSTNLSTILQTLPPFPHLQHFGFVQHFADVDTTDLSGLFHLLSNQQSTLKSLDFYFPTIFGVFPPGEAFFGQGWCQVLLPRLETLKINFPVDWSEGFLRYLHQFSESLSSLVVISYAPINSLVLDLVIPKFARLRHLHHLHLFVTSLNPDQLSVLASTLPRLHSLYLDCVYVSPDKDSTSTHASQIVQVSDRIDLPSNACLYTYLH